MDTPPLISETTQHTAIKVTDRECQTRFTKVLSGWTDWNDCASNGVGNLGKPRNSWTLKRRGGGTDRPVLNVPTSPIKCPNSPRTFASTDMLIKGTFH